MPIFASLLPLLSAATCANAPVDWVRPYHRSGESQPYAITTDADGNVYMTGDVSDGPGQQRDLLLIKYDRAGKVLWVRTWDGPQHESEQGRALAWDGDQHLFVLGSANGTLTNTDVAIFKFDTAGNLFWSAIYNNPSHWSHEYLTTGICDAAGNIYGLGRFDPGLWAEGALYKYSADGEAEWIFRPQPADRGSSADDVAMGRDGNLRFVGEVGDGDFYLASLDPTTATPVWEIRESLWGGPDKVAVDAADNTYVGLTVGAIDRGFWWVVRKYAPGGTLLWATEFTRDPDALAWVNDMVVTESGEVYVAGGSETATSDSDFTVIKLSSAGELLWSDVQPGSANDFEMAYALALHPEGGVVVTGNTWPDAQQQDAIHTVRYAPDGEIIWSETWNDYVRSDERGVAVAVSGNGDAAVAGWIHGNYFDKSKNVALQIGNRPLPPVELILAPRTQPECVPPVGGSFQFAATLRNNSDTPQTVDIIGNALLPSGNRWVEVSRYEDVALPPHGQQILATVQLSLDASAPEGEYHLIGSVYAQDSTLLDEGDFYVGKGGDCWE